MHVSGICKCFSQFRNSLCSATNNLQFKLTYKKTLTLTVHFFPELSGTEAAYPVKRFSGLYTGPYFDPSTPINITTQLGTHAYLPCKVKQLGNKSVSWIRKRDAHILTVDRYTFIADDRFQAFLVEATDTWTLQIKYVQARDAGQYECQVSTEPKMSHFITLNVVGKFELVSIIVSLSINCLFFSSKN